MTTQDPAQKSFDISKYKVNALNAKKYCWDKSIIIACDPSLLSIALFFYLENIFSTLML